jgi:hypothetical protein
MKKVFLSLVLVGALVASCKDNKVEEAAEAGAEEVKTETVDAGVAVDSVAKETATALDSVGKDAVKSVEEGAKDVENAVKK